MLHFALFSLTPQAKAAADEDEIVMEVAIPAELERDMLRNLCCVGTGGQEQPLFGCRRSRLRGVREFTLQFGTDEVAVYQHRLSAAVADPSPFMMSCAHSTVVLR